MVRPRPPPPLRWRIVVAWEDCLHRTDGQLFDQNLAEDVAEVGGHGKVAVLEQVRGIEPRPPTVHFAAPHTSPGNEHEVGVTVVRPAVAVLANGPAKLAHRDEHDVAHPRPE